MKRMAKYYLTLLAVCLGISLALPTSASFASEIPPFTALTSQPPVIFMPQGFFDPAFKYLDQGDSNILDNGDQTVEIKVSTVAKQSVDSIGASIYLERWDGSAWIQVGSPAYLSTANKTMFSGHAAFNIVTGYYYRARTIHWISHDGVYEQGERLTNTILAN